jgi:hypothetical protein
MNASAPNDSLLASSESPTGSHEPQDDPLSTSESPPNVITINITLPQASVLHEPLSRHRVKQNDENIVFNSNPSIDATIRQGDDELPGCGLGDYTSHVVVSPSFDVLSKKEDDNREPETSELLSIQLIESTKVTDADQQSEHGELNHIKARAVSPCSSAKARTPSPAPIGDRAKLRSDDRLTCGTKLVYVSGGNEAQDSDRKPSPGASVNETERTKDAFQEGLKASHVAFMTGQTPTSSYVSPVVPRPTVMKVPSSTSPSAPKLLTQSRAAHREDIAEDFKLKAVSAIAEKKLAKQKHLERLQREREADDLEECKKQWHAVPLPELYARSHKAQGRSRKVDWQEQDAPPSPFHAQPPPKSTYNAHVFAKPRIDPPTQAESPSLVTRIRAAHRNAVAEGFRLKADAVNEKKEEARYKQQHLKLKTEHDLAMTMAKKVTQIPDIKPFELKTDIRHEAYQHQLVERLRQEERGKIEQAKFRALPLPSPTSPQAPTRLTRSVSLCLDRVIMAPKEDDGSREFKARPLPKTTYCGEAASPRSTLSFIKCLQHVRVVSGEKEDSSFQTTFKARPAPKTTYFIDVTSPLSIRSTKSLDHASAACAENLEMDRSTLIRSPLFPTTVSTNPVGRYRALEIESSREFEFKKGSTDNTNQVDQEVFSKGDNEDQVDQPIFPVEPAHARAHGALVDQEAQPSASRVAMTSAVRLLRWVVLATVFFFIQFYSSELIERHAIAAAAARRYTTESDAALQYLASAAHDSSTIWSKPSHLRVQPAWTLGCYPNCDTPLWEVTAFVHQDVANRTLSATEAILAVEQYKKDTPNESSYWNPFDAKCYSPPSWASSTTSRHVETENARDFANYFADGPIDMFETIGIPNPSIAEPETTVDIHCAQLIKLDLEAGDYSNRKMSYLVAPPIWTAECFLGCSEKNQAICPAESNAVDLVEPVTQAAVETNLAWRKPFWTKQTRVMLPEFAVALKEARKSEESIVNVTLSVKNLSPIHEEARQKVTENMEFSLVLPEKVCFLQYIVSN